MILQYLFQKENKEKVIAKSIYTNVLDISNNYLSNNKFFSNKNFKSSYEIIVFFLLLSLKINSKNKLRNYEKINQYLVDCFVNDLDETFRIQGIGDMSIGKYVKKYVKRFYYRITKFDDLVQLEQPKTFLDYFMLFNVINLKNITSSTFCEITEKSYKNIEKMIYSKTKGYNPNKNINNS